MIVTRLVLPFPSNVNQNLASLLLKNDTEKNMTVAFWYIKVKKVHTNQKLYLILMIWYEAIKWKVTSQLLWRSESVREPKNDQKNTPKSLILKCVNLTLLWNDEVIISTHHCLLRLLWTTVLWLLSICSVHVLAWARHLLMISSFILCFSHFNSYLAFWPHLCVSNP